MYFLVSDTLADALEVKCSASADITLDPGPKMVLLWAPANADLHQRYTGADTVLVLGDPQATHSHGYAIHKQGEMLNSNHAQSLESNLDGNLILSHDQKLESSPSQNVESSHMPNVAGISVIDVEKQCSPELFMYVLSRKPSIKTLSFYIDNTTFHSVDSSKQSTRLLYCFVALLESIVQSKIDMTIYFYLPNCSKIKNGALCRMRHDATVYGNVFVKSLYMYAKVYESIHNLNIVFVH